MSATTFAWGLVTALCMTGVAGCGGSSRQTGAGQGSHHRHVAASCAFVLEWDGHQYVGNAAPVAPVEGKPLGTATQPGCGDTPNEPAPADEKIEVAEIAGVSPDVAIMIPSQGETILLRDDVDTELLPPEVARLLSAPICDTGDRPFEISGRWLGILGADGHTELDLDPPYDVRVRVTKTSEPAYERAELTIRVPAGLGRPLSRDDIESSLWEGGTLEATVGCADGKFVASSIDAAPPD